MFYSSSAYGNLEKWDVSNVTNMNGMFYGVSISEPLDLSGWNVCKVPSQHSPFSSSSNIIEPFFADPQKCNGGNPA